MTTLTQRVHALDWDQISNNLLTAGYAHLPTLVRRSEAVDLKSLYDNPKTRFRKTVNMAQHNFGEGEYRYFDYPLPLPVTRLRQAFYTHLAPIANQWARWLHLKTVWPASLREFSQICQTAGQDRATPLMLHYRAGGFNRLHQDIYGDVFFPFQVVILLDQPQQDFCGGEFLLVEQRPRTQAKPIVVHLEQGDAVIFPVRERPQQGAHRMRKCQMRHGVSRVHRGRRHTLGIIFHDA